VWHGVVLRNCAARCAILLHPARNDKPQRLAATVMAVTR
jgi:hypothetical protein